MKKAIEWLINLTSIEWRLWNNSLVKNLLVCPLAPGRKTPGQLYLKFKGLLGWAY